MGKVKTRLLGLEEVEEKQKKEQKEKAAMKKAAKKSAEASEKTAEAAAEPAKKVKEPKKSQPISTKPRGKRYLKAKALVDKSKTYTLDEAVSILKKMEPLKFDSTVELHLVVDETGLKGEVELPHSTGKTVRVAVVDDKVLEQIEKGKLDFDILVTHPSHMPKLAKHAKLLGPKGLMPNPKAGTISPNPEELVKKFSKGVLRWKTESKAPLIHQIVGKISHSEKDLIENVKKFIDAVGPKHILKAYVKSTMSPSLKIEFK
jgi:large subunit ribosomal protein L1